MQPRDPRSQPGRPADQGQPTAGQFIGRRTTGRTVRRAEEQTVQQPLHEEFSNPFARIKVIGVGGAGGNAINRMVDAGVNGIEFVAVNTDGQALLNSRAPLAVRIGDKLTKGLGAGGRPEVGLRAAEESSDSISEMARDADMVFIAAGMGGGTGTGASPVIARIAKAAGALTVGVVTRPFDFEGNRRKRSADEGINQLRDNVDALITIPNERLLTMVDPKTSISEAFQIADEVLHQGIAGLSDLITKPGMINLDFADVRTIMRDAGSALMAIGYGEGDNRTIDAAKQAIESPLLETSEAAEIIRAAVDEDAEIIYGTSIDESMGDAVKITLIATGFDDHESYQAYAAPRRARPARQQEPVYQLNPRQEREQRDRRERERRPERPPERERTAERERRPERDRQPPQAPRPAAPAPMLPDDDWEGESSIIRFLRER